MNTRLLPLAILLLGTGNAYASDFGNARELFRQLDTNGDRALQFSEIQAARAALLDRLDTNGDRLLEAEELRAAAQRIGERREVATVSTDNLAGHVSRMDTDGDGQISRHEFSRFIPDRIRRADTNGDRALSLRELRALRRQ